MVGEKFQKGVSDLLNSLIVFCNFLHEVLYDQGEALGIPLLGPGYGVIIDHLQPVNQLVPRNEGQAIQVPPVFLKVKSLLSQAFPQGCFLFPFPGQAKTETEFRDSEIIAGVVNQGQGFTPDNLLVLSRINDFYFGNFVGNKADLIP